MAFLESMALWVAEKVLNYLLGRAISAGTDAVKKMEQDKETGKINSENIKAYEDAKDREKRRKAAIALLNRNPSP